MKIIYFIFFLAISVIKSFASNDLDRPVEKENIVSFRLDRGVRMDNVSKPRHSENVKDLLDAMCHVKELAVLYETSLDPADQVLAKAAVTTMGRSGSAVVTSSGGLHNALPPRCKKANLDRSPVSKSIAQIAPQPIPIKLGSMIKGSIHGGSPKTNDSPKSDQESDTEDRKYLSKQHRAFEQAKSLRSNIVLNDAYTSESPVLESKVSVASCSDLKPIRLSGSVRYKDTRASSEVIQFKGTEVDKLDDGYTSNEHRIAGGSLDNYKRDAPFASHPMHHCARRSLEYGGASSVYIPDNRDANRVARFMRSASDIDDREDDNYAIDVRGVAMNMLGRVLDKVSLSSESQDLDDGDVLRLEFILLFANVHEQYLLNPDYKSAEFGKLLMNRKYLLIFLLNNEHMLKSGKISDGTAGMIFRHHIVRHHVLTLIDALKSSMHTNDVSTATPQGRLYSAIGEPQIIQNKIMSKSEFSILSKAFLDLYMSGIAGVNPNLGSASSSSSLRARLRSTSSACVHRMSATNDYPRNLGTIRLPRERSSYVPTMRELEAFDDRMHFNCCVYCVLL